MRWDEMGWDGTGWDGIYRHLPGVHSTCKTSEKGKLLAVADRARSAEPRVL